MMMQEGQNGPLILISESNDSSILLFTSSKTSLLFLTIACTLQTVDI